VLTTSQEQKEGKGSYKFENGECFPEGRFPVPVGRPRDIWVKELDSHINRHAPAGAAFYVVSAYFKGRCVVQFFSEHTLTG